MIEKEYLTIEKNLAIIKEKIVEACQKAGRKDSVVLLAATKMNDVGRINHAIDKGLGCIGENRVQELLAKYDDIQKDNVSVHFIGHLQKNKVKYIIDKVSMIQSVDSVELAKEIDRQAEKHGIVMDILLEVNIAGEESKSGVCPERLEELAREVSLFPHIHIRGLMSIPPVMTDEESQRQIFRKIKKLFIDISAKNIDNVSMDVLSMGMSDDYTIAIEEGSTMVRIGSALFGHRQYQ